MNDMEIGPTIQIVTFALFALIAIGGALGMATTMSMFRSGIFLMASFIGVAGLFLLLLADLLALLQVMMYIGGMLVMILFMVLFSHDPGGEMMAGMMKLPPIERFFSMGLAHQSHDGGGEQHHHKGDHDQQDGMGHEQHGEHMQNGDHREHQQNGEHGGHEGMDHGGMNHGGMDHGGMDHEGMDMESMSMTTPIKMHAAILATVVGVLLVGMLLLRPAWPVKNTLPDQDSPAVIGHLLMSKYMIAFEGAGMLILLGIFGAVLLARPGEYPDASDRKHLQAAVAENPAPVESEPLEPEFPIEGLAPGRKERS